MPKISEKRISLLVSLLVAGALLLAGGAAYRANRLSRDLHALQNRLKKLETAMPGVGEMMSSVQLHFSKLFFAAQEKNWGLAEFEIEEVEENLRAAMAQRPKENGANLAGIADAFRQTELEGLKKAVHDKDSAHFSQAYAESILVCNACHLASGRPFIIVKTPASPPVFNQQWAPPPPKSVSK